MSAGRRVAGGLGVLLLLALFAIPAALYWGWRDYEAPGPLAQETVAVIPRGGGLRGIAEALQSHGIIRHRSVFIVGAYLSRRAAGLHAGEYAFPAGISPRATADLLASGHVVQHRLTIPEGLSSEQIVAMIDTAPALSGGIDAIPPEGTLLPDTYFYELDYTRAALLARMERAMNQTLAKAWAARSPDLPLASPAEAVTLASIVEKETARPDERARVAGVYIDRLRIGMKLQADPTVIFALTKGGTVALPHPLDHEDLAVVSPFNTYANAGLPPTPIDNPGIASLHAALKPEQRGELYFVADGKGGHNFATTLEAHNRNVTQLRQSQGLTPPN